MVLYIDELLIVAKHMCDIQKRKESLSAEFKMKDIGVTKEIQGMQIFSEKKSENVFDVTHVWYVS